MSGDLTLIVLNKCNATKAMTKLISLLVSVVSLNFMVAYTALDENQPNAVDLEFSNNAIGIESGQPVFSSNTKVWVSNPGKKKVKLYINEEEKEISESKIELSEITTLAKGTYTLVVISEDDTNSTSESFFGFTIQ